MWCPGKLKRMNNPTTPWDSTEYMVIPIVLEWIEQLHKTEHALLVALTRKVCNHQNEEKSDTALLLLYESVVAAFSNSCHLELVPLSLLSRTLDRKDKTCDLLCFQFRVTSR